MQVNNIVYFDAHEMCWKTYRSTSRAKMFGWTLCECVLQMARKMFMGTVFRFIKILSFLAH